MGCDGSCYISKQVNAETAAPGLSHKIRLGGCCIAYGSDWFACACAITGWSICPIHDVPETRQPYHAAFGQLETDTKKTTRRTAIVYRTTTQSITDLLSDYRGKGHSITRASLVIGSQLDPASIANPHIRAHALEGQLFRSAVEQALNAHGIRTLILLERDAYARAGAQLKKSSDDMRQIIQNLARSTEGSWRAEQKVAALGAWLALCHEPRWNKKEKDENL